MKSLEPEIQRIIAKGKAEIQKLKAFHEVNDTSMEFSFSTCSLCFDSKRSLTICNLHLPRHSLCKKVIYFVLPSSSCSFLSPGRALAIG